MRVVAHGDGDDLLFEFFLANFDAAGDALEFVFVAFETEGIVGAGVDFYSDPDFG